MDVLLVARQMLILFSMMFVGYIIFRLHWLEGDMTSRLSGLVVNIFNPFLTIYSVFGKSFASTGNLFWENLVLVGLCYLILFLAGLLLIAVLRPDSTESPIYRLVTLLPNCGFMGIPVVSSLLGTEYIIYVAVYMLAYNIIIYTYGIYLVTKGQQKSARQRTLFQKIRPIVFNSGVIASVIALTIFFSGIPVADSIQSFCSYMGNPCIPLSMLLIGCSLAASDIPSMLRNGKMYGFLLLKMLIVPIACTFLIRFLPFDNMILKLFILMLSMPAGSMVVLVTEEYGGKTDCAGGGVVLSTLASIITIPVVSIFLP
ncbi:MAG: AEC family transporter [Lachnospiraceae bacterium]|nr:AEC family transporter [Lachnospiraceae bacterium]